MKIAVVGTGKIGGTLGRAFARAGHDVTFGSRSPQSDTGTPGDTAARVSDIAGAIDSADVVVLAVPGGAVAALVREHAEALGGKLVVDCANNIAGGGPANSHDTITAAAPGIRYARAFNSLGVENLTNPRYGTVVGDMFFSADESDQGTVELLVEAVGLRPVYLGDGTQELLDDLLRLWFTLSRRMGTRHLAFKVVGDPDETAPA